MTEREDDDRRARVHFESGRQYFDEGEYERAVEEFTRAYELSGRPALLMNVASGLERLGRYAEAADRMQAYHDQAEDTVPTREVLARRIANLRERAASMELSARDTPPEASPTVDSRRPPPRMSPVEEPERRDPRRSSYVEPCGDAVWRDIGLSPSDRARLRRRGHSTTVLGTGDESVFVVVGGLGEDGAPLEEVVALRLSGLTVDGDVASLPGGPSARAFHVALRNRAGDRLWVAGGEGDEGQLRGDVWELRYP
ncbi:MAG: hypothetical protein R3B99_32955 [Polyangiales bacterium]